MGQQWGTDQTSANNNTTTQQAITIQTIWEKAGTSTCDTSSSTRATDHPNAQGQSNRVRQAHKTTLYIIKTTIGLIGTSRPVPAAQIN
jgi:hypothetical protein